MDEYIEREALRNALYEADAITMEGVKIINQFPAVDAVDVAEIVRCKDCERYDRWADGRAMHHCAKHDRLAYDDDFCSYGERKEG